MNKQELFEFIKNNLSLDIDIGQSWEGGYVNYNIRLQLINPETKQPEIIDEKSGGFHTT